MISIVIRTKNEVDWIQRCLTAVTAQDYPDLEVILVDNESADGTPEVARRFGCRVLTIADRAFRYGRALNLGIEHASGSLVAVLSGHCIPAHDHWLTALAAPFDDPAVAGTYGRQVPLPDSDPLDKRDLWTTFGTERRVQRNDYLFHNANSMIRRSVWRRIRFDDEISGVEDRDWARRILAEGLTIVYEPLAAVHHHHGIHQGNDPRRAARVVQVIEMIDSRWNSRARRPRG